MSAVERLHDTGFLSGLRLFNGVDPDQVLPFLEKTSRRDLRTGELLLSPETPNRDVFVVLSGLLHVHLDSLDSPPLTVLSVGACTGEMSIIEEKDPSAFVVAAEDTHLMVIDQTVLWQLIDVSHPFCRNLLTVLSERVRSDNEVIVDSVGIMREFERNAIRDALTDLHNRHWLEDMFRRKIARLQKSGGCAAMIMLDVDHFKLFNDRFGHLAGDHALCLVADALRAHFRPSDLIVRFGGDEFAILLPDSNLEEGMKSAERVRKGVEDSVTNNDPTARPAISISAGVAEMSAGETLEELMENADAALYRAKLKGRNCVSE